MIHKLLTLLLAVAAVFPAAADQIYVGGQNRTYYTYIPANLGNDRPLLISMHGMNQDAGYQRGMLAIESVADTAKFAVVFPEGIDRSWDISGDRDINFVSAIIDDMADRYGIDRKRVYLSGFSMGGMFTYHAMNKMNDRIAAYAPISGYPMWGGSYESDRPIPIIHTHGTSDDVVTFDNVHDRLDGWIARNGCAATPLITEPYKANGVKRWVWGPGDNGVEVVLMELANKGHWISNDGIHTGNEIWLFCKQYSLDRVVPEVRVSTPKADTEYTAVGTNDGVHSIHIKANASSKESSIASVSFYGDEELIGTVTEKPYEIDWKDVPKGNHVIKVVATDAEGNSLARGVPVIVKVTKNQVQMGTQFRIPNTVPEGWVTYDGRTTHKGPVDATSNGHTVTLTGADRDFSYAMYITNTTGKAKRGYCVYGDDRVPVAVMLTTGTYELTFKTANFSVSGPVRCEVVDRDTDEVIAEAEALPTANLGGSASASFSGPTTMELQFPVYEPRYCKFYFYCDDAAGADALIAEPKLKKKSSDSIEALETAGTPVSEEYYDLLGRKAGASATGAIIRVTRYTDGSVRTTKIMK